MPKLPVIVAERGINTGTTGAQASPRDFYGGGLDEVAGGLGNVANVAMQIKGQREELDGARWAQESLSVFRREAITKANELLSSESETAPDDFQKWAATRMGELDAAAPNQRARDKFRPSGLSESDSLFGRLSNATAAMKVSKSTMAMEKSAIEDIRTYNELKAAPDSIVSPEEVLVSGAATVDARVDSLGLGPATSSAIKEKTKEIYVRAALNAGELETARGLASSHITDQRLKRTLLNEIEVEERQRDAPMLEASKKELSKRLDMAERGVAPTPLPDSVRKFLESRQPGVLAEYNEGLADIAEVQTQVVSWNGEGLTSYQREASARQQYSEGKLTARQYDVLTKGIERQRDAEDKDFVAATLNYDTAAYNMYAQMNKTTRAAMQNQDNSDMVDAARFDAAAYYNRLSEKQNGRPEYLKVFLPKEQSQEINAALKQAKTPSEQMAVWDQTTRFMPTDVLDNVWEQSAKGVLNRTQVDAVRGKWRISQELFGALDAEKNARQVLGEKVANDVAGKSSINSNPTLKAFSLATYGDLSENSQVVADMQQSVQALAISYMVKQPALSASAAVEKAVANIVNENMSVAQVNGNPVLLDKNLVADPQEFAAASKFAMGLVPVDEIAEFQVQGLKVDVSKFTADEIDAHYNRLRDAALQGGLAFPVGGGYSIQPNPIRWGMAAMYDFEQMRAKRDPNYFLKAALYDRGTLREHNGKFYLELQLTDKSKTPVLDKQGRQFYVTAEDLKSRPTEKVYIGGGGEVSMFAAEFEVPRTSRPKPGENLPSPWRR